MESTFFPSLEEETLSKSVSVASRHSGALRVAPGYQDTPQRYFAPGAEEMAVMTTHCRRHRYGSPCRIP